MKKLQHMTIVFVWVGLLVVAGVLFRDRLFGVRDVAPKSAATASETSTPSSVQAAAAPKPVAEHPLVYIHQALRATSPNYNGRGKFRMTAGKITVGDVSKTGILDPSPLKMLPLEALDLSENPVADLTGLRGMPLKRLALEATKVSDLTPLGGMKLAGIYLNRTAVADLSPLKGMPLEMLNLYETQVTDITPLSGMPLQALWLNGTKVRDISPLADCPLVTLTLHNTPVSDLSPLVGNKTLQRLHIAGTGVTDLTPLKGLPLQRLIFTPASITKGLDVVRNMKSIGKIGTTLKGVMPPERFWKLVDEGKLR
jgi:internalin A